MRKIITPCLIASIIAFAPSVHCKSPAQMVSDAPETPVQDDSATTESSIGNEGQSSQENTPSQNQDTATPIIPQDSSNLPASEATTLEEYPDEEGEGTLVGQAASEGSNAAKRKQWRNIALAVGAVVVAVTALILVASNDGHHSDD